MFLASPRTLCRSNCILILVVSNLAASAPLKSWKRSPSEKGEQQQQQQQGFSILPRILEIQLPLRIASREDLVAWSKYVMGLMASKVNNFTSAGAQRDGRAADSFGSRTRDAARRAYVSEKRPGPNYPARRGFKEPPARSPNDMVVAYPLPVGSLASNPNGKSIEQLLSQSYYVGSTVVSDPFRQSEPDVAPNSDVARRTPAATYLPSRTQATTYESAVHKNASGFEEPAKLQSVKNSLNLRIKAFNDELRDALPIDGLARRNQSREPLLTLPFQAVITFTNQHPAGTTTPRTSSRNHSGIRLRHPPDEFPPYANQTLTNESGQINVVFDDFVTDPTRENIEEEEDEETGEEERKPRKKNERKNQSARQQQSLKKQAALLGDLLRMLGILRKLPKNTTDVTVAAPVLSILRGNSQKLATEEIPPPLPNRGRRNETFQAQQFDDDDEEGGSLQNLLELLPLATPLLEELSDPNSTVNLVEVLQGAIPLLEGLFDPEEEGGIDIPGVVVPLVQRLSEGPDGEGSDIGAILGPLIQVVAPLIGPLVGPLVGPLSRTFSGPRGIEGSASIFSAAATPLSQPGLYGQPSVLSKLISSLTAGLSKDLASVATESDVKSLVSSVVSGLLAGTSDGSAAASKGKKPYGQKPYRQNDTYGSYGYQQGYVHYPVYPDVTDKFSGFIKEIFSASLKLSATSSSSGAQLSGASSSSSAGLSASSSKSSSDPHQGYSYGSKPHYGPPSHYGPSSHYGPFYGSSSTNKPVYAPAGSAGVYAVLARQETR